MSRIIVLPALLALVFSALPAAGEPSVVTISRTAQGGYRLMRNGKPYFINGGSRRYLDQLVAAGGNSIRGYGTMEDLDRLHAAGVSVMYGLPIGKPRQGFNYADNERVARQFEAVTAIVRKNKDNPALLMWALGNESELSAQLEDRLKLWGALEELAKAIKQIDPNHPVITVLAGSSRLGEVKEHVPSLDAIGLNAYGGMLKLPEAVAAQKWEKPYIVTEFGPRGHWEVAKTAWGLPIEDSSTEKAEFYLKAYQHAVQDRPQCLGSYVFLWGQKQEKTHTWYGMFLPDGSPTAAVDVMTFVWTGKWPANRAPRTGPGKFTIVAESGATEEENVFRPGARLRCSVNASDPDGDRLVIRWDLRVDVSDNPNQGGDREPDSSPIEGAVLSSGGSEATIQVPAKPGNYRIFVYAHDPGGKAATANVAIVAKPAAAVQ